MIKFSCWRKWTTYTSVLHPTEPESKLSLYYHPVCYIECRLDLLSIVKQQDQEQKMIEEELQSSPLYPFMYALKSSEARRHIQRGWKCYSIISNYRIHWKNNPQSFWIELMEMMVHIGLNIRFFLFGHRLPTSISTFTFKSSKWAHEQWFSWWWRST